ncbi:hypothetical protein [Gemmatimonas sp.]|jgi:hypothetical protein|uniref:hypothetical protein n=1 Tax=Gemmatimonas sp. TaxID=1962908 RepID=UPI0022BD3793|nr:hypothetical protein [Gemmatimonas sp.]MCZ8204283.1 hypothetical protein [Gemmatimonas sp.]
MRHHWPNGKQFAFTLFDDTDLSTVVNTGPIYELLTRLGLRVTKSIWTHDAVGRPHVGGDTCEDPAYRQWVHDLQQQGHEIALHNAADQSSERGRTIEAFDRFESWFGAMPRTTASHSGNRDALYQGPERLTGVRRSVYNLLTRRRHVGRFQGQEERSPYFWGDLCVKNVDYVRNFVFQDLNTLKSCPQMPYTDPTKPWANAWFASSEAATPTAFRKHVTIDAVRQLEAEGGACILYTHLGAGFYREAAGGFTPGFREVMEYVASRPGWFVPVASLLDYLKQSAPEGRAHALSDRERRRLEWKWLMEKVSSGKTS